MIRHRVWQTLSLCALACLSTVVIAQEESESGQPQAPGASKSEAAGDERSQPQAAQPGPLKPTLPPSWVDVLKWRSIGPANMSGRFTALAVYEKDPNTWWAATASGGLLKTTNNGITFEHQFDRETTVSIGDVQVAPSDSNIVWVGTGEANPRNSASWGDGVYKSTDGGQTWKNMGLKQSFQIGRIAIHPQDPNIVYVGALGRLWGPNEERGLFKTTDAGATWQKILYVDDKTGVIDVQMHPQDPNALLVATYERQRDGFDGNDPAKKHGPGSGVYLTKDGGATYQKVTQGLPTCNLGRIGISYSRQNPQQVFLVLESEKIGLVPENAGYAGIRGEDADAGARIVEVVAKSPAEEAGLKAGDIVIAASGNTVLSYRELQRAIDQLVVGDKLKLNVSRERKNVPLEITLGKYPAPKESRRPGRPLTPEEQQRVNSKYAAGLGGQNENLEQGPTAQEYGGIYQSQDGGLTWQRINSLNPRPMYYSQIRVDPTNGNHIWVLGTELYLSKDGGKTFESENTARDVHVDHHAMWIDPRDGRHVILGNDGGIYVTYDQGANWDHHNHVAVGQFYHVAVGPRRNYSVYGGLQDNGSWGGPSRVAAGAGPVNADWISIGGGDGFVCQVDPLDPDQIYSESQGGATTRMNLRTGERSFMRARPPRGTTYRFNWKTPFILSPHNSKVYYSAGNYVFRSPFKGDNLKAISPEITRTDEGSASALTESPVEEGVLYAGTTDGALWNTKDGGHTWVNLFGERSPKTPAANPAASTPTAPVAPAPETPPPAPAPAPVPEAAPAPAPAPAPETPPPAPAPAPVPETAPAPAPVPAPETPPPAPAPAPVPETAPVPAPETPPAAPAPAPPAPAPPAPAPESAPAPAPTPETAPTPAAVSETPAPAAETQAALAAPAAPSEEAKQESTEPTPSSAPQEVVSGTWEGRFESESMSAERRTFTMILRMDAAGKVTGSFKSANSDGSGDGKFDPATKEVTLTVETRESSLEVTGTIAGIDMTGNVEVNNGDFTVAFTAKRTGDAPAVAAAGAAEKKSGRSLTELLPGPRWVSSLEASRFQRGRVYMTCDGHRSNDDKPYVLVSEDYGATWQSLVANLSDSVGSAHVLREDLTNENILYLGTEFSIYVSVDRGRTWTKLNSNLPTVAVHEIALHPTAGELVAATHGRSLWILDVSALRQITGETLAAEAFLYAPQHAVRWRSKPSRGSSGTRQFVGENPPSGAAIYYSLGRDAGSVELRITDIEGRELTEIVGEMKAGLHRVTWDLRRAPARAGGNAPQDQPRSSRFRRGGSVPPGQYLVTLVVDDKELKQVLTVEVDPDAPADASDRQQESADFETVDQ